MKTNNLTPFSTIATLKDLLDKKKIHPKEIYEFYVDRFKKYDHEINAALEIFAKSPVEEHTNEILSGIPGLIKDNICQQGKITSCASHMLENYKAPYDATAIKKLKKSGAIMLGRANMDEFAMGSSTETSAFFKTKNPWDLTKVPGGSSGGSAAAVAAGLVPFALGSDTGGSVRQPAAFCGVVGLKPTYGLISRYGLIAYASSIDQVGIFSHTVFDNALVLSAISGFDEHDATTLKKEKIDYTKHLNGELPENLTIGIVEDALYADGMDSEIVAAIEGAISLFTKKNVQIKKIKLPMLSYTAACYFIISRAEAASNLARFDGIKYGYRSKTAKNLMDIYLHSRAEGFGQEVQARIMVGNYVLSAGHADEFYQHAKIVQSKLQEEFSNAFKAVDLLIMPTHPTPAFSFDAFEGNKLQMDLQDYFTCGINLAKIPAISIPCGFTRSNLPIGMQLVGPQCSEELLFQVGHAFQQETDFHMRHPEKYK